MNKVDEALADVAMYGDPDDYAHVLAAEVKTLREVILLLSDIAAQAHERAYELVTRTFDDKDDGTVTSKNRKNS